MVVAIRVSCSSSSLYSEMRVMSRADKEVKATATTTDVDTRRLTRRPMVIRRGRGRQSSSLRHQRRITNLLPAARTRRRERCG